jgi:hypothetical protein
MSSDDLDHARLRAICRLPQHDRWQQLVGQWADRTFTESTPRTIVAHLRREVEELVSSEPDRPDWSGHDTAEEAADCYLLLLHLAHRFGFSLYDAATKKHLKNVSRAWGQPDVESVVEHVREGEA